MTPHSPAGPAAQHPRVAALCVRVGETMRSASRAVARNADRARRLIEAASVHETETKWERFDTWTVSGANLLVIFLFACYLDIAVFAAFMLAFAALLLASRLQSALLIKPYPVAAARDGKLTAALVVLHAIACLALCVILAAAGWLVSFYTPRAGHVLIALALTAPPWLGHQFIRRLLRASGEPRAAAINDGITYGLQVFGALVLAASAAAWATAISALSVLALSSGVGLAVGCWLLRRHAMFEHTGAGACEKVWMEVRWFRALLSARNIPGCGGRYIQNWRARGR